MGMYMLTKCYLIIIIIIIIIIGVYIVPFI